MECRIYKGQEYFSRDIQYLGKYVVFCPVCMDVVSICDSEEEALKVASSHDKLRIKGE